MQKDDVELGGNERDPLSEPVSQRCDKSTLNKLVEKAYEDIHRIAQRYMKRERRDHTLRPTELVSEVFLRLAGGQGFDFGDQAQFCAVVARTIRQILVDHARKRCADKRGRGKRHITLDDVFASADRPEGLVAFDAALSKLAGLDERKARTVELFYFGGFSQEEIAAMYGVHVNTVARDLRFAEGFLAHHLGDGP